MSDIRESEQYIEKFCRNRNLNCVKPVKGLIFATNNTGTKIHNITIHDSYTYVGIISINFCRQVGSSISMYTLRHFANYRHKLLWQNHYHHMHLTVISDEAIKFTAVLFQHPNGRQHIGKIDLIRYEHIVSAHVYTQTCLSLENPFQCLSWLWHL